MVSFNGNKIITTSGGGMLLCHDEELAAVLATFPPRDVKIRSPLRTRRSGLTTDCRMCWRHSVVPSLPPFLTGIERRRQINSRYRAALSGLPGLDFMPVAPYGEPNWWLTASPLNPEAAGYSTTDLRLALEAADIEARPTWKPMHLQPLFADAPARVDGTSARLFSTGLCLPSGSGMTDARTRTGDLRVVASS